MILDKIYGYFVKRRNRTFDSGSVQLSKCKTPVISIGNIIAGGSGKTPFVIALSHLLESFGKKTGIIGRGYKRQGSGLVVVSDGISLKSDLANAGDEMYMIAGKLKVPVVVDNVKSKAALFMDNNFDLDFIIVDDGFQHRNLFRDIDILIIDKQTLSQKYLLPAGRLREPFSSIERAHIIALPDDLDFSKIKSCIADKFLIRYSTEFGTPYNILTNEKLSDYTENFIALSGIANPIRFSRSLIQEGINISDSFTFSDHYDYKIKNIKNICLKAVHHNVNKIITTEKDSVKLLKFGKVFAQYNVEIYALPLDIVFSDPNQLADYIYNFIDNK